MNFLSGVLGLFIGFFCFAIFIILMKITGLLAEIQNQFKVFFNG